MKTITGLDELKAAEGEVLGTSDWHEVTQDAINDFADVTGDHQWIHVDVERAKETPFGGTIAHGYLTLSLGPALNNQVFSLEGFAFALNYGLNKVRFPAPLPVESRIRMHVVVAEVKAIEAPGGEAAEAVYRLTYEVEGQGKPCCVADLVFRYYP
jgi:acyl dehydratase